MNRPVFRTSLDTPVTHRTDSNIAAARPQPFGWDPALYGPWEPEEETADAMSEVLARAGEKLDVLIEKLEQKASKAARNRLRARFGLQPSDEGDDQ